MIRAKRRTQGLRSRTPLASVAAFVLAIAGAAALTVPSPVAAAVYAARIDGPRSFGYTIGDVMTERVLLAAAGRDVGDVEPPASGRVDLWLERRPARVETDRGGRRWLVLDYQIANAPRSLQRIALPALSLRTGRGDVLQAGAWPISVGPIVPDTTAAPAGVGAASGDNETAAVSGAAPAMQPDRGPPSIPLAPIVRRFGFALACLLLTLAGWLAWWVGRNRRDAARLPFARGWLQMRALCAPGAVTQADGAWRIIHRALNETAGQVIHMRSLSALFACAPWLLPMRPELERFYARSNARFFEVPTESADGTSAGPPVGAERDAALVALLHGLFRAERRRHR